MADNLTGGATTGQVVATDDIGGIHHPYVKVEFGADGAATRVSQGDPLPVNLQGTYNLTPLNLTNGGKADLQVSGEGALLTKVIGQQGGNDTNNQVTATKTKPVNAPQYASGIYETPDAGSLAAVMRSQQASIQSVIIHNFNTTTGFWLQIHNSTTTPTVTASRQISFYVPAAAAAGKPGETRITEDDMAGILYMTIAPVFYASVTRRAMSQSGLVAADCQITAFLNS